MGIKIELRAGIVCDKCTQHSVFRGDAEAETLESFEADAKAFFRSRGWEISRPRGKTPAAYHCPDHNATLTPAEHRATLMKNHVYEFESLIFRGWTDGDGSSTEGYNVGHYFDRFHRYCGPDIHGIEPLCQLAERD